jgi:hypothetical protein
LLDALALARVPLIEGLAGAVPPGKCEPRFILFLDELRLTTFGEAVL